MRIFAWRIILDRNGLLNLLLTGTGLLRHHSSAFLYTTSAVVLTLTSVAIPYVFVAAYAAIERVPFSLVEAAKDNGASAARGVHDGDLAAYPGRDGNRGRVGVPDGDGRLRDTVDGRRHQRHHARDGNLVGVRACRQLAPGSRDGRVRDGNRGRPPDGPVLGHAQSRRADRGRFRRAGGSGPVAQADAVGKGRPPRRTRAVPRALRVPLRAARRHPAVLVQRLPGSVAAVHGLHAALVWRSRGQPGNAGGGPAQPRAGNRRDRHRRRGGHDILLRLRFIGRPAAPRCWRT